MIPFRIEKSIYPSYSTTGDLQIWDLEGFISFDLTFLGNQWYTIQAYSKYRDFTRVAHFAEDKDRQQCMEDIYLALKEAQTHIRTEYIPA